MFAVPIVLFVSIVEIIVKQIPNSYSYKYNYVKHNGQNIRTVVVGHSQLYDGFNPQLYDVPSFNLCNSAQNYMDDYYILKELLQYMPNLETVILPIGYMNFRTQDTCTVIFDYRRCYYHEYMNIDYDRQLPFTKRYEWMNLTLAISKIQSYYFKHIDIVGCDSLGMRSTHHLSERKHKLGTNKLIEGYTRYDEDRNFIFGQKMYFIKIMNLLINNNVSLILVSPPYYWNYTKNYNEAQKRFADNYISELCKKYPFVKYINMETDTTFVYDDFFDEAHLSEMGAEKFTKMLNDILEKK